jgi:hypothetical protein
MDNIHIMGHLSEISHAFDHLSTQLTLIGLRIKVLKCKLWNPSKISLGIKIPQNYTLVTNGLHILGVQVGFQDFATHFLNEVLFQDVVYIDNLPLQGDT